MNPADPSHWQDTPIAVLAIGVAVLAIRLSFKLAHDALTRRRKRSDPPPSDPPCP